MWELVSRALEEPKDARYSNCAAKLVLWSGKDPVVCLSCQRYVLASDYVAVGSSKRVDGKIVCFTEASCNLWGYLQEMATLLKLSLGRNLSPCSLPRI